MVVTKEHAKFQQNVSSVNFVDISYHSFITTRQNNLHNWNCESTTGSFN